MSRLRSIRGGPPPLMEARAERYWSPASPSRQMHRSPRCRLVLIVARTLAPRLRSEHIRSWSEPSNLSSMQDWWIACNFELDAARQLLSVRLQLSRLGGRLGASTILNKRIVGVVLQT